MGTPTTIPITKQTIPIIKENGNRGIEYPIIKSFGFSGDIKSLVKKEELLSFAINSPRNIVVKVNPNMVIPGTIFTGLKTSIGAFFEIVENKKINNTGSKIPKINDKGSLVISFKFLCAKYIDFIFYTSSFNKTNASSSFFVFVWSSSSSTVPIALIFPFCIIATLSERASISSK